MKKGIIIRLSIALTVIALAIASICTVLALSSGAEGNIFGGTLTKTVNVTDAVAKMMATSNHYIVVKAKQFGGSHYAYTEAETDAREEYNFEQGSKLVALSILDNGDGTASIYEKDLLTLTGGIVRDPSVSADGRKVLYSKKTKDIDDFHIYEMDLTSGSYTETQLTFGSGIADIEPQYLPNGDVIFSSTRDVQTVDCWYTPVSNLFIMNGDGSCIRRVGYDQVHTTFPTVTSDGRVLYTRWDYNDRTQMFVQGVFQMFPDGSYQTEVWGNDADFPTTLLHTREIPGAPGKYVSIASGHHVQQKGKLVVIDTNAGRNSEDAIKFLFPDSTTNVSYQYDTYAQNGRQYKYPYALDEQTFLVSAIDSYTDKRSPYSIYLCDRSKSFSDAVVICEGSANFPASQIVPIKTNDNFDRVSLVDYSQGAGMYYVANVYAGDAMKGAQPGSVKYLRVVALEYRSSAIGATTADGRPLGGTADVYSPVSTGNGSWDVKNVLGVVPVEEDGSALFEVPSDTPVYFQLLDENGSMIQTMRSWSTLTPGETFSCIGCHENKNLAPDNSVGITMAMKKGVQRLQKDLWMQTCSDYDGYDPYTKDYVGFSYADVIQPILDGSCTVCHSNVEAAYDLISSSRTNINDAPETIGFNIPAKSLWNYSVDGGEVKEGYAPFGTRNDFNTSWSSGTLTMSKSFLFTQFNAASCETVLTLTYSGSVTVKVNGTTVYTGNSQTITEQKVTLTKAQTDQFNLGQNTMEITVSGGTRYIDCSLRSAIPSNSVTFIEKASTWKYVMSANSTMDSTWMNADFDDSSWSSGQAPFGDRGTSSWRMNTSWTGTNTYIWVRQEFNVTSEQLAALAGGTIGLNIYYDDHVSIYINGTRVFADTGWVDSFTTLRLNKNPSAILHEGRNVIAISLYNTGGGRVIDTNLFCTPPSASSGDVQFSLSGDLFWMDDNRPSRAYPLSYLVLTGSYPDGNNWKGRSGGNFVKWISTMSKAEMIDVNDVTGSAASPLITRLRSGHGSLSDEQIRAIACWIDLAVPCNGSYDEGELFSSSQMKNYLERVNKRNFFSTWDAYSKMDLGGILPEGSISASFVSSNGKTNVSGSGEGYLILNVPTRYTAGDTLTVNLSGSSYVAVSLNDRQGESLIYAPSGSFTYTVPSTASAHNNSYFSSYTNNTIFLRIPTDEELATRRNVAKNSCDLTDQTAAFPHASSNNVYDDSGYFYARNAIDGFTVNGGHMGYPYQSWGPDNNVQTTDYLKIDFGREVRIDEIAFYMRADGFGSANSHDAYFSQIVLEFSDGSSVTVNPRKIDEKQAFAFDPVNTTYVKLTGFVVNSYDSQGWAAISEVEVYGSEANAG